MAHNAPQQMWPQSPSASMKGLQRRLMTWTESAGGRLEDGGWQVTYTQRPIEEASDDPLLEMWR